MKNLKKLSALLGFLFLMGLNQYPKTYQVISSHPEDVEQVFKLTKTQYQNGRLWIVSLRDGVSEKDVKEFLRPTTGEEKSYEYVSSAKRQIVKSESIIQKLNELNQDKLKSDVEMLTSFRTRAAGSAENQAAVASIAKRMQEYGYNVRQECYRTGACSIVARKAGANTTNKTLMLMAHLDSVGHDFAGADDNASGTAVLLEIARIYSDFQNKKNIEFFITNGEELGLLGAKDYVKKIIANNRKPEFELVINMDMVGYNSNGVVELETNRSQEILAQWFAELSVNYTTLKSKITLNAWGSDHVPFLEGGIPALLTIEDWSTKTPCYHKQCDKPETINFQYMLQIAKLNAAALMTKDQAN
jgi:hypothetical protein